MNQVSSAFKFSASSSFLTFHWMSIFVCKVKVFGVFIIFLCVLYLLFRYFFTLKFVIWLLCFALCAPCAFVCLASVASKDYGACHLLNQKPWHTKFALDVNFKIITFHTILFLGFEAWISYLCHEMVLPYAPNVGCLAWLTLMGKKHLAPYLTEHNGHLGWKI